LVAAPAAQQVSRRNPRLAALPCRLMRHADGESAFRFRSRNRHAALYWYCLHRSHCSFVTSDVERYPRCSRHPSESESKSASFCSRSPARDSGLHRAAWREEMGGGGCAITTSLDCRKRAGLAVVLWRSFARSECYGGV